MHARLSGGPSTAPADSGHTGPIDRLDDRDRAAVAATPLGLYVHVPFCVRRCGYCAFTTYVEGELGDADAHGTWARAAAAEVELADRVLGRDRPPLTSVYFGGGTPTAVDPALLTGVLDTVRDRFEVADDLEVTVESNPDGLREGQLRQLCAAGVTRMSFGLQSVVPRVLALLDRTHDPGRALAAVGEARNAGVESVGLDLIHGTPGERAEDWSATVTAALGAGVDHLSAYALTVEPGTRLAARVRRGDVPGPDDDVQADRYRVLDGACRAAGLSWYEVSNWARRPADRCRHHLLYWRDQHWWGVGPGAHSHIGATRWWNHTAIGAWSAALAAGRSPTAGHERVDTRGRRLERLMLGIRLAEGVPVDVVDRPDRMASLAVDGLVEVGDGRVRLSAAGRLFADLVARELSA